MPPFSSKWTIAIKKADKPINLKIAQANLKMFFILDRLKWL